MTDTLRDKIARAAYENRVALIESDAERQNWPAWDEHEEADADEWRDMADAVLAVIDLDKVRAEAWDDAWAEVRSIPHWWNPDDQYGEFDMLPLGPDETTERGAFMAVREVLTNNPYRKAVR